MRFVDSHLHLESGDALEVISRSEATGTMLLACGVDSETSLQAIGYARPGLVLPFVGVHPSEALKEKGTGWLRAALERAAGAGEIGLDPKYSPTVERGGQMKVFVAQLAEAGSAGKPVQVHSRDAEKECLEVLGGFSLKAVLMHWFQDEGKIRTLMDRGYFVSFGPSLIYSKRLQRMARACDIRQVLTETDSPVAYGTLGGARGPSLVPSVLFRLAELWGVSFEDARGIVHENAMRYLGSSGKG